MSSSPTDIVKVFYGTYSLMGAEKARQYLADDFQLLGFTPLPMDRAGWIGFLSALKKALPDLKIRLTNVRESGDEIRFTEMGLGTHRLPLDLSAFGLPVIPVGGVLITFPNSEWVLTVTGGKIARAELLSPTAQTGLAGILMAFNVEPALAG
jgi:hypothetical protein